MIIIEIENKEYNLPQSWDEITVGMFAKIMKHSMGISSYKSEVEFAIEMFAIVLKAPIELLRNMTRDSFLLLSEKLNWVNDEIVPNNVDRFNINGVEYQAIKNFDKLKMSDTINIELMINESKEYEILSNILPMLIRPIKKITKDNGEIIEKICDFDADNYKETRELFNENLKITDVYFVKQAF